MEVRGKDERPDGQVGLQSAGCSQAEEGEPFQCVVDVPRFEIYVGQRVEFGHDDIDVVGPDAGGYHGQSFAFAGSRYGVEFAVGDLFVACVEMGGHHG